jgi:4-hydroxy-2-oxoheptanedioate aldolase
MSSFRDRLAAGETQIGFCSMYPAPGILERVGGDWDFVWIDAQHGELDYTDQLALVRACNLVGAAPIVRVPWLEAGSIGRALDMAAAGVIVPCIDSVAEARAAVDAAKFPPLGRRSYGGRRPIDLVGRTYSDRANVESLLFLQIESPRALDVAAEIAALDGVDGLMLGPDDMLLRGVAMTTPRTPETLAADMRGVAEAARKHGKLVIGIGFDDVMIRLNVELGVQMIVSGGDVPFLAGGSKAASGLARKLLGQKERPASALVSSIY